VPPTHPPHHRRVHGHGLVRASGGRRRRSALDHAPPRRRTRCQVRAKNKVAPHSPSLHRPRECLRDRVDAHAGRSRSRPSRRREYRPSRESSTSPRCARLSLLLHPKSLHISIPSPTSPFLSSPFRSPFPPSLSPSLSLFSNSISHSRQPHAPPLDPPPPPPSGPAPLFPHQSVFLPLPCMCVYACPLCLRRSTTVSPELSAAPGVSRIEG
jgi:hypothetical protein